MFERILAEMREAARVGLVYLAEHARDEMAVVAKLTYNNNVGVIIVYRLRITDDDYHTPNQLGLARRMRRSDR